MDYKWRLKGKAIAKRLLAVLLAIVGKHSVNDPICLAWKDDLTKHSCSLLEEDITQVRCEAENQGNNSENMKEETQLDWIWKGVKISVDYTVQHTKCYGNETS